MRRAVTERGQAVADDAGAATPGVTETADVKSARSLSGLVAALFPPRVVLFLALFAWILQARVDMRLVFQWREGLFLLNFRFLGKFPARPGALMEWTDRLLVQSCYWGWPGAVAVTAAAWLLLVATIGLMDAMRRVGFSPPLPEGGLKPTLLRPLRWLAGTALLLTAAAVAGCCAVDRDLKAALEIDYCAEHRLWADVIAKAGNLPPRLYSPCVNHDVNLALYHTGRLPYDMFAYPQMHLPLLAYQSVPRAALMRKPFDLLLELGCVNEAEHVALEMLEEAPCGGTLKRLALVKLTKGQTAAAETGMSISEPRASPDGRYLLFCMSAYGGFPVYRPDSDLYLLDLRSRGGKQRRLACNSAASESWHCWSSNSRWIVFSSKRDNGWLARPYFSYIDAQGGSSKPFLLPQRDPAFCDAWLKTYNVPELITGPIATPREELLRAINTGDPEHQATPCADEKNQPKGATQGGVWHYQQQ
jgi:hypothetical protein